MDSLHTQGDPSLGPGLTPSQTVFTCERLNNTTFLITENDRYKEHPFIYVKVCQSPPLMIISDTGCGGSTVQTSDTLRNFLETYRVAANGHQPLNPRKPCGEPSMPYFIIFTHCHYDHILGVTSFQGLPLAVLASSHGKSFVCNDLPKHSLCCYLDVPTPQYDISYWAVDMETIVHCNSSLRIKILHTPGHTPDELAWYDEYERHLFVGDSFYERVSQDQSYTQAIIFPREGSLIDYIHSLKKMIDFVEDENAGCDTGSMVKIGCGHVTSVVDGSEILHAVLKYSWNVIDGKIPVKHTIEKRGEIIDIWQKNGKPRFSLEAPRRLALDARKHFGRNLDSKQTPA